MLGLLGTTVGFMQALLAIQSKAPLVHAGDLAEPLWQALITTAAGLVVAIPTYAGHRLLENRVDAVVLDMDRASSEMVSFLTSSYNKDHGTSDDSA